MTASAGDDRDAGETSPATTYSPLVGAEIVLPAGGRVGLAADPSFEHAVLVDRGAVTAAGTAVAAGQLAYLAPGRPGTPRGGRSPTRGWRRCRPRRCPSPG